MTKNEQQGVSRWTIAGAILGALTILLWVNDLADGVQALRGLGWLALLFVSPLAIVAAAVGLVRRRTPSGAVVLGSAVLLALVTPIWWIGGTMLFGP